MDDTRATAAKRRLAAIAGHLGSGAPRLQSQPAAAWAMKSVDPVDEDTLLPTRSLKGKTLVGWAASCCPDVLQTHSGWQGTE